MTLAIIATVATAIIDMMTAIVVVVAPDFCIKADDDTTAKDSTIATMIASLLKRLTIARLASSTSLLLYGLLRCEDLNPYNKPARTCLKADIFASDPAMPKWIPRTQQPSPAGPGNR